MKEGDLVSRENCQHRPEVRQPLSLQCVDLHEPYTALIDMGMIWRMATPSAEDRQTQGDISYKWSNYVQTLSSIILPRHVAAERIICVNDPYDAAYSTIDDERDLRVQRKAHVPNTYMKLDDPSPLLEHSKRCSVVAPTRGGCKIRYAAI